jgi:sec-independent protein translocase protein TatA
MPNLGIWEILLLLLVLLLVFGPKRLPEMGRSLGRGMREFKDSVTGHKMDDDDEQQVELTPTSTTAAPAATPAAPPVQSETERVSS